MINATSLLFLVCSSSLHAEQIYASPDVQYCQKDAKDNKEDTRIICLGIIDAVGVSIFIKTRFHELSVLAKYLAV